MKGPSILQGIGFAAIVSLASGVAGELLPILFSSAFSSLVIVLTLSLAYLFFLLKRSQSKHGRVVTIALWLALSVGGWLIGLSLIAHILLQLSMIWIVRSLYFHTSLFAALLDLILIVMASAAGVWAILQTDSFIAAVWCFFLAQSLYVAIPDINGRKKAPSAPIPDDHFQHAYHVAQEAVRKLSLN